MELISNAGCLISRAAGLYIGYIVAILLQEGWYDVSIAEKAYSCYLAKGGSCPLVKNFISFPPLDAQCASAPMRDHHPSLSVGNL